MYDYWPLMALNLILNSKHSEFVLRRVTEVKQIVKMWIVVPSEYSIIILFRLKEVTVAEFHWTEIPVKWKNLSEM